MQKTETSRALSEAPGSAPVLDWNHPTYYPVECRACGWQGMSDASAGGEPIADTGDYSDIVCPKCIHEGGHYMGRWIPLHELDQPNQ